MSWETLKLGDVCQVDGGYAFKSKDFSDDGFPIIRISNLTNATVNLQNVVKIPDGKLLKNSEKFLLKQNDILIAMSGATTGKIGVMPARLEGRYYLNQRVGRFRILDFSKLIQKYLFNFVSSSIFHTQVLNFAAGAAQPNISPKQLVEFKIPLPPLETQKQIVDLLDRAQALIDKRKEQIALMDQLIQSLFYDMFGDPNSDKTIPTVELNSVCKKITDGTHQSPEWSEDGYPFLFVSNIKNRKIDFNTSKFISPKEYKKLTKTTPIEIGDILYTVVGSYGNPALVKTKMKFAFQRHIGHIKPNTADINPVYLESTLNSLYVKRQVDARVTGVAQKTLILKELKKIKIILPSIDLQNTFAKRVQKIEAQKETMTASLQKLENNFNSIMQRAFKGEL